jgi:hypothetical protein
MKFEVFMLVNIKPAVLWDVTLYLLPPCSTEDGSSRFFQNVGNHLLYYTVSHTRRLTLKYPKTVMVFHQDVIYRHDTG